jgi:transposase
MTRPLVTDDLWIIVKPLLPPHRPRRRDRHRRGGRPPVDDRRVLAGIVFVLKTGIPWEYLPQEMHCGCGMTCWRRLRDWNAAGVWRRLHQVLLDKLNAADKIDWSRGVVDSASIRALHGGKKQAQIRSIGARAARSTTCSSTARGVRRWRSCSPAPTATT